MKTTKAHPKFHGKGIMKKLILDRGFLDGVEIGRCKKERGIDVLIPVRRDMDIYADVVGLAKGGALDFKPWKQPRQGGGSKPVPAHRPERIRKREEARQRTLAKRKADNPARPADKTLLRSEEAVVHALTTFSTLLQ